MSVTVGALAETAAESAVREAQQYRGQTITVAWPAGLQALDPRNFSGPKWEELTGIKVKVVELPVAEMLAEEMKEFKAGTGAYDAVNVVPTWMPELVQAGALEDLGPYVDKYGYRAELRDIAPGYRDNQMRVNGKVYGFPDDGDVFVFYYRKDIFADPKLKEDFKAKTGRELAVPKTWSEFDEVGQFLTDKLAPNIYGAGLFRQPNYAMPMFEERFRVEGGKFFNPETMKSTINSAVGIKVFTDMRKENRFMPPGVEQWGSVENLVAFLLGKTAMTIAWPPDGRWAAGYGAHEDVLSWVPKSTVVGKVGYALPPGGHPEMAGGFALAVASTSKNKDAAYLFIQWLNSEDVSLERVQLPYALRDPFRISHFANSKYSARWPDAKDYLKTLREGAETGLLDLSLLQTDKYESGLRRAVAKLWAGDDPKAILDQAAAEWDAITEEIGVARQKAVYLDWASKPGAYPTM